MKKIEIMFQPMCVWLRAFVDQKCLPELGYCLSAVQTGLLRSLLPTAPCRRNCFGTAWEWEVSSTSDVIQRIAYNGLVERKRRTEKSKEVRRVQYLMAKDGKI